MRRLLHLICPVVLGAQVFGQVSEKSLQALYGNAVGGSYQVGPGITMTAFDGPKDQACVLKMHGLATDQQVMAVFDRAVPLRFSGPALRTLTVCHGSCQEAKDYQKLTIISAVIWGQNTNPSAIVLFKNKICDQRSKEARVAGFEGIAQPKPLSK